MRAVCNFVSEINCFLYIFKGLSLEYGFNAIYVFSDDGFMCATRYEVVINNSRPYSSAPKVGLNVLDLRTLGRVFIRVTKDKGGYVIGSNDDGRLVYFFKGMNGVAAISASAMFNGQGAFFTRFLGCAGYV